MYNSHYGFSCSPFENNLDQRFLFFSAGHQEVFSALLYFVKERKGFALVCGDVGTGKTMLVNHLLGRLPKSVHPIVISNPGVNYTEILRYIAGELGIANPGRSLLNLLDEVKLALIEEDQKGKRFVLIIDEAHLLEESSLEAVRLLSNFETQENKLLQILLIGQYELSHKLSKPGMRQLRQRINVNRFLAPMKAKETIEYIHWRLKVAGSNFDSCFEPDCHREIFKRAGGVPRAINRLCDTALLIGKSKGVQKVNRKIVKLADEALQSDILSIPAAPTGKRASQLSTGVRSLAIVTPYMILVILTAFLAYRGLLGTRAREAIHSMVPAQLGVSDVADSEKPAPGSHDPDSALKTYSLIKPSGAGPIPPSTPATRADPVPETAATPEAIPADASPANLAAPFETATAAPPAGSGIHPAPMPSLDEAQALPEDVMQTEPRAETWAEPVKPVGPQQALEASTQPAPANFGIHPAPMPSLDEAQALPEDMMQTEPRTENWAKPVKPEGPQQALEASTQPAPAGGMMEASVPADSLPEDPPAQSFPPGWVVVQPGDTLTDIALRWYQGKRGSDLKRIIAANPGLGDGNLIYPGQVLSVPEPNPVEDTIESEHNSSLHFAIYGQYNSMERLLKEKSWLTRHKIKYVIRNTTDRNGGTLYQILVGGFESAQDLEKALARVKSKTQIKGRD